MQLKDIMTTDVHAVDPKASLIHAAKEMKEYDVGALAVMKNGKLSGLVTDRDLAIRAIADGKEPSRTTVGDVMTRSVVTCSEDTSIEEAVALMEKKGIRRLVINGHEGHAKGIISLSDIATRANGSDSAGKALQRIASQASSDTMTWARVSDDRRLVLLMASAIVGLIGFATYLGQGRRGALKRPRRMIQDIVSKGRRGLGLVS